ncbi:hypothetical protein [Nonomuraea sp. NPDC050310]|uniref:hypothetical protein n=1 Tax=unclassified Nonomuraea TaxID=2593643 RepID=UPI00340C8B0F
MVIAGTAGCGGDAVPPAAASRTGHATPRQEASGQPSPSPRVTSAAAARLSRALLATPRGMQVAYGPEVGPYGGLEATRRGLEAMRQARLSKPQCAGAGQLDAAAPAVASAPAAVVAFASDAGSLTEALVTLPPGQAALPAEPPAACRTYTATVGGSTISYLTRRLPAPMLGQESRASLTTTTSSGQTVQIATGTVRHGNVIMSILMVGSKIKPADLRANVKRAYKRLTSTLS